MHWRDRNQGTIDGVNSLMFGPSWLGHTLLISLLRGKFASDRVVALWTGDSADPRMRLTLEDERPGIESLDITQQEYDRLIHDAVQACRWFDKAEKDLVCEEILRGNEDTVTALLICLCPDLKALWVPNGLDWKDLPQKFSRTTLTIVRITQAYNDTQGDARAQLPLQHLELIETPSCNGEFGFPLDEIPYLLGIPSLKLAILDHAFEQRIFETWPKDALSPVCPEVYIEFGSISKTSIMNLASAWKTPCVFRQIFQDGNRHAIRTPREPEWRSCHIEVNEHGESRIEFDREPEHTCADGEDCDHDEEQWQFIAYNAMREKICACLHQPFTRISALDFCFAS